MDVDYPVEVDRVGLYGVSNGGMLSAKAACEEPGMFPVAMEFAGMPSRHQVCNEGKVHIAQ